LEQKLEELLAKDYLVDPQVSVVIKGYGSIYIIGEVRQPGPYQLSPNMTLMTALALAGGITESATPDQVRVIRHEGGAREVFEISLSDITQEGIKEKDLPLKPNDVVLVRKSASGNVYVLGQVVRPGEYPLQDNLTVVEAITLAGGLTKVAAPNRTRIVRVEDGVKRIIKVPVNKILEKGDKKKDVVLQSDDVIMVPESFF
jgi:polysaccharide export outer membrane protein